MAELTLGEVQALDWIDRSAAEHATTENFNRGLQELIDRGYLERREDGVSITELATHVWAVLTAFIPLEEAATLPFSYVGVGAEVEFLKGSGDVEPLGFLRATEAAGGGE